MQASALFGAGWEHESVEVLWQEAGRAFCRLGRDDPAGDMHAFIPFLFARSTRCSRASIV